MMTLSLLAGMGGCRAQKGGRDMDPAPPQSDAVALIVKNEHISHVDIHVVGDGISTRIGTVPGLTTRPFVIDKSFLAANDFRVLGTPIGQQSSASTGRIVVKRGETIYFTVKTTLRASTVSIH